MLKCSLSGVKLNIGDTIIGDLTSSILGYDVSKGSVSPGDRLTRGIKNMRIPKDRMELKSLLASCNVIRNFVPNYNTLIAPLSHLLQAAVPWVWSTAEDLAFLELKRVMQSPAVLKPFDPSLQTRLFCDFNGAKDTRRPALGASLWQLHTGDDGSKTWHPAGYASRYLSISEINLITRESAFSSSIGECLGFSFAMRYFYPELSQLSSFTILCDARNLTYWKTSSSPLMVNLRATVSQLYDLRKVQLQHVPRETMFADVLGRLSHDEYWNSFNEFSVEGDHRVYAFSAYETLQDSDLAPCACSSASGCSLHDSDLTTCACSSASESSPAPASSTRDANGFILEQFSEEEIASMKASSQSYTLHSNRPVTRKLHGRLLFVVPQSQISRVWDENHVSGDGLHFTLARTRLNVSHLSWPKKFSDLRSRFASCEACAEALGPKGFPAVELYTGQSARPGSFGEVVFFDTKSYQTRSGRQHLGTSLDKTTGCHPH